MNLRVTITRIDAEPGVPGKEKETLAVDAGGAPLEKVHLLLLQTAAAVQVELIKNTILQALGQSSDGRARIVSPEGLPIPLDLLRRR